MPAGARTPEELETLFEDAFVLRDQGALAPLFEAEAVLDAGGALQQARGREEIERFVTEMWDHERTYLADPRRVLQAQNTALILSGHGINVVRRADDGSWRYAILFLEPDTETARPSSATDSQNPGSASSRPDSGTPMPPVPRGAQCEVTRRSRARSRR